MAEDKINYEVVIKDLRRLYEGKIDELLHEIKMLRNPGEPPKGLYI